MTIEIAFLISISSLAVAVVVAIHNMRKDNKQSVTKDVEQVTKINMKLDELCRNTADIKNDVKFLNNQIDGIKEELIVQKQEIKALWRNVDKLNGKDEKM